MYRENIYEIIEKTGEKITTLVIPKNTGLKGYAWKVLSEAGLKLENAKEIAENVIKLGELTLVLRRGEDIPQWVVDYASKGEVVLGVTGDDLFDEFGLRSPKNPLKIENTYDWFDESARFFRPTLCFINRTGSIDDVPLEAKIALNAKYAFTSREYLRKSPLTKGINFRKTLYNGDVELSVAKGINDCCIDTVYSGETIDENGLKIIQKIRFSDIVVISPLKGEESMLGRVINEEYRRIKERKDKPTGSYTSELLQDNNKIAQKVCEEIGELVRNLRGKDPLGKGNFIPEMADSIYSLMLMLVSQGYTLDDIAKEMLRRQK